MSWLRRLTLALALLLAAAALPIYAFKVAHKLDYTDFEVYHRAASRARAGDWANIYTLADGASPFRYSPAWLVALRPLAELPLATARQLWFYLQYAWFALGFWFLYRSARLARLSQDRRAGLPDALWVTALSAAFVLRFCLDCFTIGQVSSLMFLGFCAGLYGWMIRSPALASLGIFVPASFKIGPGLLYGIFVSGRARERKPALLAAAALTLTGILGAAWLAHGHALELWRAWARIVTGDSTYYDASHYGSQSIKSALLRFAKYGWIVEETATRTWLLISGVGSFALIAFWFLRRPKTFHARGLFYSLGIFPYLWFMPETFKYSLTALALPVAMCLAAPKKTKLTWIALAFGAVTLSLAGKDILDRFSPTAFFTWQRASLPLVATLLIGAATFAQAMAASRPSRLSRWLAELLAAPGLGPWEELPPGGSLEASLLVPLPLRSHATLDAALLARFTREIATDLRARFGDRFEILLAPYGDRRSELSPLWRELASLGRVVDVPSTAPADAADGRGMALRRAFLASSGRRVLVLQPEQPVAPEFFSRALDALSYEALSENVALVRGNRRLEATRFRVPVRALRLVHRRHRLALAFNSLVRMMLPSIRTTDTQSGSYAMTRELAAHAFAVQSSPDFLFDLELSLAAASMEFGERDLPVTLHLTDEKSGARVWSESLSILLQLPRLARRARLGCYGRLPRPAAVTADDWGLSPGINRGILELARLGVVRRVSIMASCTHLDEGLAELRATPGVALGLHFNLTYGAKRAADSPGRFLRAWLSGQREAMATHAREELEAQLARLARSGVHPVYMDGHHHIQVVPGLLETLAPRLRTAGIRYVRLPYDRSLLFTRRFPLFVLSWLARARLRRLGFEHSPTFFYPGAAHFRDHGWLRARLARDPAAEVIVHPARENDMADLEYSDIYTEERVTEFRALRMLGSLPT
jgi:predicted glycoside hydrolase/deacetylase ChbG (UPF0249 family)